MATEDGCIGTYDEFTQNILPRIQKDGYNAVQLMAIMEHPYYASFGYQVSNFFAPSSWYGEPEGLKRLINTAHEMGMLVFLDLVHSHACANTNEGLSMFDGTETQFLRPGAEGWHEAWGSRVFNYGKHEVIHFLLSNIKYWQEEFHFDGFRFDGVTSMIYRNHGLGENFTGYDKYFSLNTDVEAVTYLQLATELIHAINPFAVAIAEDMSGMPGMCLPIRYGGIGYAIMDLSTEGDVKLYAQPHPNKTAPESLSGKINKYLENNENLKLKSHPINCHGLLTSKVEDIPQQALYEFLDLALDAIKDTYYKD